MVTGLRLGVHGGLYVGEGGPDDDTFKGALVIDDKHCITPCYGGGADCIPVGLYIGLSGFSDFTCSDCENLNDTFYVPYKCRGVSCETDECITRLLDIDEPPSGFPLPSDPYHVAAFEEQFTGSGEPTLCGEDLWIYVHIFWERFTLGTPSALAAARLIVVDITRTTLLASSTYMTRFYKQEYGLPYRCLEFDELALPNKLSGKAYPPDFGGDCNNANAACTVTSPANYP